MEDICFRVLSNGVRLSRSSLSIPLLFFVAIAPAVADVNSWTKPTSGSWEEQAYWSLGVLPGATQDVVFTNAGWKALAIGAATATNFPQSMTVQSLRLGAPLDSFNTLLLNWSGLEQPLHTTSLTVASNSAVIVQGSALEVSGSVLLGGNFIQSDFSQVKAGSLSVRVFGISIQPWLAEPAHYFLTNGTLSVGGLENIGGATTGSGTFAQYGGENNAGTLQISPSGTYELFGGEITATNGFIIGYGDFAQGASFVQYGGSVKADTSINGGYTLNGGTITGRMAVPPGIEFEREDGAVTQNGGTNFAVSVILGPAPNRFGGRGFYTLQNGLVRVDTTFTVRGGQFSQYNGVLTIVSNFVMDGSYLPGLASHTADYLLQGGILSASGMSLQGGVFSQNGGTNLIAGNLLLVPAPPPILAQYHMAGGLLSASNLTVGASQTGGFGQSGGTIQVAEKLTVDGQTNGSFGFVLAGGTLAVKDVSVSAGATFQHNGGSIIHSGVLTLNQGNWYAATNDQTLGPLQLTGSSASSTIYFPGGSSILRFANSSGQAWSATATLFITNWHGSASGAGATRLFFGSNANGLTSQQLALIKFYVSGSLSPARILATGEVVPDQLLTFSRSGNDLTLSWGPGWTLQSATNVAGPYQDVLEAPNPYPVPLDDPSRFFRLRK